MLVKVNAEEKNRAEILRMTEVFRGKIVDVSNKTYTVEITGTEDKLSAFLKMIRPLGLVEVARTGTVAISRSAKVLASRARGGAGGSG